MPRRVPSKTNFPAEYTVLFLDWSQDIWAGAFFNGHKMFNLIIWLFRKKIHVANGNISHPKQWPQINQKELLKTFDMALSKDKRIDLLKAEKEFILRNAVKNSR